MSEEIHIDNGFDPETIEHKLRSLQRELSPGEARSTLLNLLIVSKEEEKVSIEEVLSNLLGRRSARIIHIALSEEEKSDISINARCIPDREDMGVCFQEIYITAGKDGKGAAPGSWTPVLIRDIPTIVLWMNDIVSPPPILHHVLEQSDKVIVDSENRFAGEEDREELFRGIAEHFCSRAILLSDLTWKRIEELRRLSARVFNQEPLLSKLYEIEGIEIQGGNTVSNILYLSWIAAMLGWKQKDAGYIDSEGQRVYEEARTGDNADISIRFRFRDNSRLSIFIDKNSMEKSGLAGIIGPGEEKREEVFSRPPYSELLLEELDSMYDDPVYRDVISFISQKNSSTFA